MVRASAIVQTCRGLQRPRLHDDEIRRPGHGLPAVQPGRPRSRGQPAFGHGVGDRLPLARGGSRGRCSCASSRTSLSSSRGGRRRRAGGSSYRCVAGCPTRVPRTWSVRSARGGGGGSRYSRQTTDCCGCRRGDAQLLRQEGRAGIGDRVEPAGGGPGPSMRSGTMLTSWPVRYPSWISAPVVVTGAGLIF